ncbi:hypothetical protein T07_14506, partial [Trichinella nelsoni]
LIHLEKISGHKIPSTDLSCTMKIQQKLLYQILVYHTKLYHLDYKQWRSAHHQDHNLIQRQITYTIIYFRRSMNYSCTKRKITNVINAIFFTTH